MVLKPQDILVLLKLVSIENEAWSYNRLAVSLGMSPAEVHAGVNRALAAQLASSLESRVRPNIRNLEEFLIHGLRYVFVPDRGEHTRGMPTMGAAAPLADHFTTAHDVSPVWPDAEGAVRGFAFSPLYRSVPQAARRDSRLYELLVLVDALRGGNARERVLAIDEIQRRLRNYVKISTS